MLKLVSKRIFAQSQRELLTRNENISNFMEKPAREHLKEGTEVNRRQMHITHPCLAGVIASVILTEIHNLQRIHEKTPDKLKLRDIVKSNYLLFFKTINDIKYKEKTKGNYSDITTEYNT